MNFFHINYTTAGLGFMKNTRALQRQQNINATSQMKTHTSNYAKNL
jgi:hypothetical protein